MEHTAATDHPRPLLRRAWQSLDGPWAFAFDRDATARHPGDIKFDRTINVPFAPETPASGISDMTRSLRTWYRREVPLNSPDGQATVLTFGAVDRVATIWLTAMPLPAMKAATRRSRSTYLPTPPGRPQMSSYRPTMTPTIRTRPEANRNGSMNHTSSGTRVRAAYGGRSGPKHSRQHQSRPWTGAVTPDP